MVVPLYVLPVDTTYQKGQSRDNSIILLYNSNISAHGLMFFRAVETQH